MRAAEAAEAFYRTPVPPGASSQFVPASTLPLSAWLNPDWRGSTPGARPPGTTRDDLEEP